MELANVAALPQQAARLGQTKLVNLRLKRLAQAPVPDDEQSKMRILGAEIRKDPYQGVEPLLRLEPANRADHDLFSPEPQARPHDCFASALAPERAMIDPIQD